MTKLPFLPVDYYEELISHNGNFYNGLLYNFNKPQIYNYPPFKNAFRGELTISKRDYIGLYQGNYILYVFDETCYIIIKIFSLNKKCKLKTVNTDKMINDKLRFEKDIIITEFKNFIELLKKNIFIIETLN